MNIAILDDYQHAVPQLNCFELLKDFNVKILDKTYQNPKDLAKEIQDAEILVLIRERTKIDDELLSLLPNLKLISQTGKISNHLDLAACTKYGVAVAEGVGSPIAPAELTWALIMNATRKIPQAIEAMKKGEWQTNIGSAIHGKTIGIWGYFRNKIITFIILVKNRVKYVQIKTFLSVYLSKYPKNNINIA